MSNNNNNSPNYDGLIIFGIKIPKDKILHFIAGLIISLVGYGITKGNIIAGLSLSLAAGIAKELFDAYVLRNWADADILDILATFIGGIGGVTLISILKLIN